jgi:predicted RND superfamily exporter protein
MSLGPAEIVIVIGMILCVLVAPTLVLVGFIMLFRRLDKVEQDLKAIQEKQNATG